LLDDLARMNACAVNRPAKQFLAAQNPIARVEIQWTVTAYLSST
jgi:hypothetical protein